MKVMKLFQGSEAGGFKHFSKLTIHKGTSFWTGHVALGEGDTYEQAKSVFLRYDVFLPTFAQRKENILQALVFIRDIKEYRFFLRAWNEWFKDVSTPPALTCVEADLAPGHNVEICLIVAYSESSNVIDIEYGTRTLDGYSDYVVHNGFVRYSAKRSRTSQSMLEEMINIFAQYEQTFSQQFLDKSRLIMANIYMSDVSQLDSIWEAWRTWVGADAPALMVQQSSVPDGKKIAIALTLAADRHPKIERFENLGGYCSCVKYNRFAHFSAITAECNSTANMEGVEVFRKIDVLAERAGLDKRNAIFIQMVGNNFPDFYEFDVGAFRHWSVTSGIYPAAIGFSCQPPNGKSVAVAVTFAY